jgi:hypothetical protein
VEAAAYHDGGMQSITTMHGLALFLLTAVAVGQDTVEEPYFGIHVVDEATGRGVPLVELRTVNDIPLVTDSAGWVAFHEPGLMDREVFFAVEGPGYEHAKDGFGIRGVRLKTAPGKMATVKVKRTNIAERMYRVTGEGIFRDSELLGLPTPAGVPSLNAGVVGQDSVQAVPYRDRIFWLWGDTNLPNYPLGNFQTTAATSPLRGKEFDPQVGVPLTYFAAETQGEGKVRAMAPLKEPGVVWLFGLLTVSDPDGREALVAHYSRRKDLFTQLEHGLVRFNDDTGVFEKLATFDLDDPWRFPSGNARLVEEPEGKFFYFSGPFANKRVPADWKSLQDPQAYQALACVGEKCDYRWQNERPPTTQAEERKLIDAGKLPAEKAHYQLIDCDSDKPVRDLHHSSIVWNDYRKKWIQIGLQQDPESKVSHLGEVWYAESDHISGPWRKAIKIASHPKYSFYNPRQHTFLDEDGGRVIYFEGTYTRTFSGNPTPTPRYEYNQLMYRLNLADERLKAVQ